MLLRLGLQGIEVPWGRMVPWGHSLATLCSQSCLFELFGSRSGSISRRPGLFGLLTQALLFLALADVHHLQRFAGRLRGRSGTFATIRAGNLTFCSGHGTHRPWQDSLTAGG